MNYDEARQRERDGRWDWTTANRRLGTFPDGYCAGWYTWTQADADRLAMPLDRLLEEQEKDHGAYRAKFHTDGHATKEEAERCYYEYSADHLYESGPWSPEQKCRYPECRQLAEMGLENRGYAGCFSLMLLCNVHRTVEVMRELQPFKPDMRHIHS